MSVFFPVKQHGCEKSFLFVLLAMGILLIAHHASAQENSTTPQSIADLQAGFEASLQTLDAGSSQGASRFDALTPEVSAALTYARDQMTAGNTQLAIDALIVARGILDLATQQLPTRQIEGETSSADAISGPQTTVDLTEFDTQNLERIVGRVNGMPELSSIDIEGIAGRLEENGFDVNRLNAALEAVETDESSLFDFGTGSNLSSLAAALANIDSGVLSQMSFEAGRAVAGLDINSIANTVANAIASGIDIDLNSMAQGLGFDSFADAVDAYNSANGTSYSVDEAAAALGK